MGGPRTAPASPSGRPVNPPPGRTRSSPASVAKRASRCKLPHPLCTSPRLLRRHSSHFFAHTVAENPHELNRVTRLFRLHNTPPGESEFPGGNTLTFDVGRAIFQPELADEPIDVSGNRNLFCPPASRRYGTYRAAAVPALKLSHAMPYGPDRAGNLTPARSSRPRSKEDDSCRMGNFNFQH